MGQKQTRNVANIIPAYLGQAVGYFRRHIVPKTGLYLVGFSSGQIVASIWHKIGPIRNPQMGIFKKYNGTRIKTRVSLYFFTLKYRKYNNFNTKAITRSSRSKSYDT